MLVVSGHVHGTEKLTVPYRRSDRKPQLMISLLDHVSASDSDVSDQFQSRVIFNNNFIEMEAFSSRY